MAKGVYNGIIAGNPTKAYEKLINWDVIPQPSSDKMSADGFFLQIRQSFKPYRDFAGVTVSERWRVTDSYIEDNSGCKGGNCYTYYYCVNETRSKYVILRKTCGSCEIIPITLGEGLSRCPCASDKFFEAFARSSENLSTNSGAEGEIYNFGTFGFMDVKSTIATGSRPKSFQYVSIVGGEQACGQVRQIVSVTPYEGDGDYSWTLQFTSPRSDIEPTIDIEEKVAYETSGVKLSQFVSNVPAFVGMNGIQTIVDGQVSDTICDYGVGTCIVSATNHNGQLTYLTDQGINFYGGQGLDSNAVVSTNFNNVGTDKLDAVSFQNFLVFFGRNEIKAVVFSEDGLSSFEYNLSADVGIHNRGARAKFNNGLYYVGTDKRIYAATITGAGTSFRLSTEDITSNIRGDMDIVRDNEEVFMSDSGGRLHVFINGRDDDRNTSTNKTKICVYLKNLGFWLRRHTCSQVITGEKYGEFLGENIYKYCGRDGDGYDLIKYSARAEAVLYDNSDHGLTDSAGLPLNYFRRHSLQSGVFLLGIGDYSDNTYIEVEKNDGFKYKTQYPLDGDDEILKAWSQAWNCKDVDIPQCFVDNMPSCANINNPCEGSLKNCNSNEEDCGCNRRKSFEDYCICYDDKGYALSPIKKFEQVFDSDMAEFYKVSLVTDSRDVVSFGGMLLFTNSETTFDGDVTNWSNGSCCAEPRNCPSNSC